MLARHDQRFRQLALELQASTVVDAIAQRVLHSIDLGITNGIAFAVLEVDDGVEVSVVRGTCLCFFEVEGAGPGLVV